jgi:hypothetical protein
MINRKGVAVVMPAYKKCGEDSGTKDPRGTDSVDVRILVDDRGTDRTLELTKIWA